MGRAYRTLLLKYRVEELPKIEKVIQFLKEFRQWRRWAAEWVKSGGRTPLPKRNPLKYFAKQFIRAGNALDWLAGVKKNGAPRRMRALPVFFDAQLRLSNERDESMGVIVDLPKKEVRIRKWSGQRGNTIVLPLSENAVRWIEERVREGGRLVLAMAWVGHSRRHGLTFYVALIFRRETAPIQPKRLLVVDFNALHNGVVYAVVEESRILRKGVLRPDASKLIYLQRKAAELDASCASSPRACRQARAVKSRIWRLLRQWEDEVAKKIVMLALQYKVAIIVDIPNDESMRQLKESNYSAERKALLNFGRLRRRMRGLAEWHGLLYKEERLYSTICPRCGSKMEEVPERRVKCKCGFEAHRDEVPAYWAQRRFKELLKTPSFSAITVPTFVITVA